MVFAFSSCSYRRGIDETCFLCSFPRSFSFLLFSFLILFFLFWFEKFSYLYIALGESGVVCNRRSQCRLQTKQQRHCCLLYVLIPFPGKISKLILFMKIFSSFISLFRVDSSCLRGSRSLSVPLIKFMFSAY